VYAVGLAGGPGFFAALRRDGLRFNAAVAVSLVAGALLAVVLGRAMGLSSGLVAGAYCGGLTNTPALAAATDLLRRSSPATAGDPALGYSLAYPFGVLGGLLALATIARIERASFSRETAAARARDGAARRLLLRNFAVTNPALFGKCLAELRVREAAGVVLSRVRHGDRAAVPTDQTRLHEGDTVLAVGSEEDLARALAFFGAPSDDRLEIATEGIEVRRLVVSNRDVVGKTLGELRLGERFNAQATRLRRGDVDIVPLPDMRLEPGDRLRIVAPADALEEVARLLGDSPRRVAELDYTAIALGIAIGVAVGMVPIPIPGGGVLRLGFAGGPLLVALVLGKLGRTGPFSWFVPYEANMTMRHIGLLLFLAGVGVTAGGRLTEALARSGWQIFILGAAITIVTTTVAMVLLRVFGRAGVVAAMGATAGMHTQPATLARAHEMTGTDDVYVAYATTYPVAMIAKILIAQAIIAAGG